MESLGSDIFGHMARLERELGDLAAGVSPSQEEGEWRPPVDIYERDDALVLVMDLPGVRKEDIDLQVDGATLTVQGEKTRQLADTRSLRLERPVGRFRRSFRMGAPIDPARVKASYRNGVLEIVLPKAASPGPVRLHIDVA